ncbi:hypothetical protein [Nocardioides ginsengisoli]
MGTYPPESAGATAIGSAGDGSVVYTDQLSTRANDHNVLMVAPAGHGKTNTLRGIAAQDLARGGSVLVVDSRVSGASFRKVADLPNLMHGHRITAIHRLLTCLADEMAARAAALEAGVPAYMPLTVAVEGLDILKELLSRHWMRLMPSGGPVVSPALDALRLALFEGGPLDVRVIATTQRPPSASWRDQFGVRVLGRQTRLGWDLLGCGEPLQPAMARIPGRMHVVFGHDYAIETQVPLWTDTAVREWASRAVENQPFPYLASTTWGDQ